MTRALDERIERIKPGDRLPLAKLLPLALAAFVTILTEALPAGLLAQMSAGLGISQAAVGQTVTAYAAGSLLAAIPLVILTQRLRRRPLLLAAIAGFVVTNALTALSASYALTMAARFIAGVSAGLIWALLAGYAARMVPEHRKGAAIAVAMAGTPLALSLGVPAGTLLGTWTGWRVAFGVMSVLAVMLLVWVRAIVPDFAGQARTRRPALRAVLRLPGVRPVLLVVLTFVLAHNLLYTYIASFLATAGMSESIDRVLLMFGLASLFGILIVGVLIDQYLRVLTLASTFLFAIAVWMLDFADGAIAVYASVGVWGLAFGGAATLFQTALADAAGEAMDAAQAVLVTVWNLAIAGGGVVGGVLLDRIGIGAFFPVLLVLLGVTFVVVWSARSKGFPARMETRETELAPAERCSR